ncbi:uncharacterized protein LOC135221153 [Macrobrachium nipponense]|uniref:uncharacterized protein LOC135221153 n=1 Tax=Macrobrachium nipponense TaxID=159736 RepID=UPI0030C7E10B
MDGTEDDDLFESDDEPAVDSPDSNWDPYDETVNDDLFREFLTLHSALEDDQKLRSAMKGVKGPNKWLNLPFSKLDSTTIATRKQFLEKYLQSVIQRPELNISTPVKEFLAYGLDSSVSFVKKPLELHVPRLDKLLAKTVSGVFHSIKTALPSFESSDNPVSGGEAVSHSVSSGSSTGGDVVRNRSSSGVLGERSKLAAFLSSGNKAEYELKLDITAEEEECQIEEALTFELSGIGSKSELVDTAYEARESRSMFLPQLSSLQQCHQFEQEQQVHQHSVVVGRGDVGMGSGSHSSYPYPAASPFHHLPPPGPRSQGDGCDISTLSQQDSHEDSITEGEEDISWKEWPLSVGLLEMIVEIFGSADHPLTHQPCVTLLTLTMARITHKWLQVRFIVNGYFSLSLACILLQKRTHVLYFESPVLASLAVISYLIFIFVKFESKEKLQAFAAKFDIDLTKDKKGVVHRRKHKKVCQSKDLKEVVYKWYVQERSVNVNVCGVEILDTATKLAEYLDINFSGSTGRLWKFRSRHGIRNK